MESNLKYLLKFQNSLYLFTYDFPFGNSELSFIKAELRILSQHYKFIYILPWIYQDANKMVELPKNVVVINHNKLLYNTSLLNKLEAFNFVLSEMLLGLNFKILCNFRYHYNQTINYIRRLYSLKTELANKNLTGKDILYSYWYDEWTTILCLLKKRHQFKNKIVTRAHGFDLYEYRNKFNYIFPRNFQMKFVDKVLCISTNGTNYLKNRYKTYSEKFYFAPLGTERIIDTLSKLSSENGIRLVSCSSLIELKRVGKIIEILAHSNVHIIWTHFGDGPLINELKTLSKKLPDNVSVDWRGFCENSVILEFYKNNFIDFFINVSEYEGIPVSIMEAISCGIPIIATNVGGVSEIVNDTTGILIPKEFDAKEICELIINKKFTINEREKILEYWKKNFFADENYRKFNEIISS